MIYRTVQPWAEGGRLVEVTRKQGIRYRDAQFLGKTDSLVMLSDESGEVEIWMAAADGMSPAKQLTKNSKVLIMDFRSSPDGKYLAYANKDYELWIYDIAAGQSTFVDRGQYSGVSGLSWSPDGQWLAYMSSTLSNQNTQVSVYQLAAKTKKVVTTERLDSYAPQWSPDGKWLYFLSDREFNSLVGSPWGSRQPEPYLDKTTKIYALALYEQERFPFLEDTELTKADSKKDTTKKEIQLTGLESRLYEVPAGNRNFSNFIAGDKYLYWTEFEPGNRSGRELYALKISNEADNKPQSIASGVRRFSLSGDGKKLLVYTGSGLIVAGANGSKLDLSKNKVDFSNWSILIDPVEDWRQMLVDAWRLERDYFYDRNLHGVDWPAMLQKHLPLVARLTDRYELDDLMAHMVAELSALHTFVNGGDKRDAPAEINPASLGARLDKNAARGGYVIQHIYATDPDYPDELSPLAQPHLQIAEGDVITAVNGVPALSVDHLAELLPNQAGQQVRLSLQRAQGGVAYEAVVKPISTFAESNMRYSEWEYTRRKMVDEMSDQQIGYVHLRAMGNGNYTEWVRNFYPVFDRPGLIIDVRHNRGGNIDSWILEKLMRKAWFYWQPRVGKPYWNMQYAFRGHMATLVNERTASDGEAFAEGFRRLGMGKIIGTRTWGGEVWLTSSNRLVDNGIASAAEFGVYADGEWLIEGHGVDPDIVVDNPPHATFAGEDAQLKAAVDHLLKLIREDPRPVPPAPAYPDKSFKYKK